MNSYSNFDNKLKTAISETVDNITVSQNMFTEINKKIKSESKGESYMKFNQPKKFKTILVACTLLVATSATGFAAAKYIYYNNLPTTQTVSEQVGFAPKYVQDFKNGYTYFEGGVDEEFKLSDNTNVLEMRYEKNDNIVSYLALKAVKGEGTLKESTMSLRTDESSEAIMLANKIDGLYISSDKYISVVWEDNGVLYSLSDYDKALDKSQLADMANEIINK